MTLETEAQCEIKVGSNMVLSVAGDVAREVKGAETVTTVGPVKFAFGSTSYTVTAGAKSDTFLGISNTNTLGMSVDFYIGGKVSIEVSGSLSVFIGTKNETIASNSITTKSGASLTVSSSVDVTATATKVESVQTKISKLPVALASRALYLQNVQNYIIS